MSEYILVLIAFAVLFAVCAFLYCILVNSDEKQSKIANSIKIEEVEPPEHDISSPVREIAELFKARPQDFVITSNDSNCISFKHVTLPIKGCISCVGFDVDAYIHGLSLNSAESELLTQTYLSYQEEFRKQKELRNRARITKAIKDISPSSNISQSAQQIIDDIRHGKDIKIKYHEHDTCIYNGIIEVCYKRVTCSDEERILMRVRIDGGYVFFTDEEENLIANVADEYIANYGKKGEL